MFGIRVKYLELRFNSWNRGKKMETDLTKIGMYKEQQYEVIITTIDKNGNSNAAPFGLRVLEDNEVFLRIFEGGNTIKNIKEKGEFIVNITNDPLMFTLSTTNTIPDEYLTRIPNKTKNDELIIHQKKLKSQTNHLTHYQ